MRKGYYFFEIPESMRQSIFGWLCAGFAFSIPFKAIFNSILVVLMVLYWLVFLPKKFASGSIRLLFVFSVLFWLGLIGIAFTQNLEEGWFRLQQKTLLVLIPLVILTVKTNPEWQRASFSSMVFGTATAGVFVLGVALQRGLTESTNRYFFSHDLVEPLDIYTYLFALLCVLAIVVLVEAPAGKIPLHARLLNRPVRWGLIAFFSALVFLLSVKQVIVVWAGVVAIYGLAHPATRLKKVTVVMLAVIMAAGIIVVNPTLRHKMQEVFLMDQNTIPLDQDASLGRSWNGIALRKAIWTCSADVLSKHYLWGVGTGDVQDELQHAYHHRQFYFASQYNHFNAHNQYLQSWIAHGLVGLLAVLAMVFLPVYWTGRKSIFVIVGFCWLLCWLTESMLETNKGIVIFAFMSSWISALYVHRDSTES